MKRYSDETMKLTLLEGVGFREMMVMLINSNMEIVHDDNFHIYIQNPPIKLFQYPECFEWIKGISYLWAGDTLITKDNYKNIVPKRLKDEDISWYDITNVPPKSLNRDS